MRNYHSQFLLLFISFSKMSLVSLKFYDNIWQPLASFSLPYVRLQSRKQKKMQITAVLSEIFEEK